MSKLDEILPKLMAFLPKKEDRISLEESYSRLSKSGISDEHSVELQAMRTALLSLETVLSIVMGADETGLDDFDLKAMERAIRIGLGLC